MPSGIVWDDEQVALLKKLWGDGNSATQIAARIGCFRHCKDGGRSAVLGKVHRLGLSGRITLFRNATKPRKARAKERNNFRLWGKPRPVDSLPSTPLPPPHETDIARVSFVDLEEGHCKFICGDPKGPYEPQFCGEPRVEGLPYCAPHCHRAYQTPKPAPTRQPASVTLHALEGAV